MYFPKHSCLDLNSFNPGGKQGSPLTITGPNPAEASCALLQPMEQISCGLLNFISFAGLFTTKFNWIGTLDFKDTVSPIHMW